MLTATAKCEVIIEDEIRLQLEIVKQGGIMRVGQFRQILKTDQFHELSSEVFQGGVGLRDGTAADQVTREGDGLWRNGPLED